MAKQPISIVRGTTFQLAVSLTDEDGNPYALQSGELLRYGLKKSPNDAVNLTILNLARLPLPRRTLKALGRRNCKTIL